MSVPKFPNDLFFHLGVLGVEPRPLYTFYYIQATLSWILEMSPKENQTLQTVRSWDSVIQGYDQNRK